MKKSRNTRQRGVIVEILRKVKGHLTAEEIYREARKTLPNISLGTVYRNLTFLREHGLVREVRSNRDTSSRFEGDFPPHAHFHCTVCGHVDDLPLPACLGDVPWSDCPSVARVAALDLHVIGACSHCLAPVASAPS